jgi:hypothetical protein
MVADNQPKSATPKLFRKARGKPESIIASQEGFDMFICKPSQHQSGTERTPTRPLKHALQPGSSLTQV